MARSQTTARSLLQAQRQTFHGEVANLSGKAQILRLLGVVTGGVQKVYFLHFTLHRQCYRLFWPERKSGVHVEMEGIITG